MNTRALLNVPAFPPVAAKLLRVAADENAAAGDMVRLLRSDPALSAGIIRYANSPLFNFTVEIRTLEQAVPLLGIRKIRSLALSAIGRTYLRAVLIMDELRVYWRYSLACALLAETLAPPCRIPEDLAYSAGLLHDIGRLGLMVAWPADYSVMLQAAARKLKAGEAFDLPEYERSLFGMDRFTAGAFLARQWNLPEELASVVGRMGEPDASGDLDLAGVVRIACRLANCLGFSVLANPHGPCYQEVLKDLPPAMVASLPRGEEKLRLRLQREIDALDQAPQPAERSRQMQTLLEIEHPTAEPEMNDAPETVEPASPRWPLWPAVLAGVAVFVILLVWMRMAG
jgi:HD-like signal output (HDOD) protein